MDIALATGTGGPSFVDEVDLPLVDALTRRGARVHRPVWHDPAVDWSAFDLVFVRTPWDYTADRDAFVAWAARTARQTALWNPADVLRWNTHKSYLIELEERGAPVVPTAWIGQGDRIDLAVLMATRGWKCAVVKPAVGSSSEGLLRVELDRAGDVGQRHLDALAAAGDALVQPYLAAIEERGELSVVVIDGEVSHAVRKLPADGDLRVQEEFGGRAHPVEVDTAIATLARWVVDATGVELLVARVDLLEDATGAPQVLELEATEPDLFLVTAPAAADRLAEAVLERVRR